MQPELVVVNCAWLDVNDEVSLGWHEWPIASSLTNHRDDRNISQHLKLQLHHIGHDAHSTRRRWGISFMPLTSNSTEGEVYINAAEHVGSYCHLTPHPS